MIDRHHIHPRFIDNKKGTGKQYDLEHGEHIKLHNIIPSIIWKYVEGNNKKQCINEVIKFSERFIKNINNIKKGTTNQKELFRENITEEELENIKICCLCGYENDIEDIFCNGCGGTIYENTISEKEEDLI